MFESGVVREEWVCGCVGGRGVGGEMRGGFGGRRGDDDGDGDGGLEGMRDCVFVWRVELISIGDCRCV